MSAQRDNNDDYQSIELFEYAKNNTNDHCKRMSHYYSTIDDVNLNNVMYDTPMTDSIALIQSETPHGPYYNINSSTGINVNGESDEQVYVDPGFEEDGIYSWLRSRKISTIRPYEIK